MDNRLLRLKNKNNYHLIVQKINYQSKQINHKEKINYKNNID